MQQRVFKVPQIHCQSCQNTISSALADVDGVRQVDPDQATDQVTVTFDETRVDIDRIGEILADAGFPVERVTTGTHAPRRGGGDDPGTIATLRQGGVIEIPADAGAPSDAGMRDAGSRSADDRGGAGSRYGVLVAAVLAIALAGYFGYVLYPRFDLAAAEGAGLLGLAAAAGIASFFSPCSFPLLLSLLGRQGTRQADQGRPARALVFGGALALGAAVFMAVAGVVIGLGGEALFAGVTFTSTAGIAIRSIVGALLIVLGLAQIGRLSLSLGAVEHLIRPLSRRQAKLRRQHPVAGFGLFGFSYVLAGFG